MDLSKSVPTDGRRDGQRNGIELSKGYAMNRCKFKLFVSGRTLRAACAVVNLRRICEEELEGRVDWIVIDVLEHPQLAEKEKILATPTLIKEAPLLSQRVIGVLSDKNRVLSGLNLPLRGDRQRRKGKNENETEKAAPDGGKEPANREL